MGYHYIPQYYLKGFELENRILVHDRKDRRSFPTQVASAGHENKIWTKEVETWLSSAIEGPANPVIKKIRAVKDISNEEQYVLAKYIITMWRRVPATRSRVVQMIPDIAPLVESSIILRIEDIKRAEPDVSSLANKKIVEVRSAIEKLVRDKPSSLWSDALKSHDSKDLVESLMSMKWRFLVSEEDQFITSDCPVFIFKGLQNSSSDLSIPFGSYVSLVATRNGPAGISYGVASRKLVREVNRRVLQLAVRFAYSSLSFKSSPGFLWRDSYNTNGVSTMGL
jgi:hypothetical protein